MADLVELVGVADDVTEHSIDDAVVSVIREEFDDKARARVYNRYDNGDVSEDVARTLLGDEEFEVAERMTEGTEGLLSQDPSRYTS